MEVHQWLTLGVGTLTRPVLRGNEGSSLDLGGFEDGSLAIAAANLAKDPATWLQTHGGGGESGESGRHFDCGFRRYQSGVGVEESHQSDVPIGDADDPSQCAYLSR
jgi:hypothetical protein